MKDKFIYIKKNAIKNKYCDNIVKKLKKSKLDKPLNENMKNFYEAIFNVTPHQQEWFKDFCVAIEDYKKLHPYLAKGKINYWNVDSLCNYQRYLKNQSYSVEHCEHSDIYAKRVLAWMFYCNNIKEGGETRFPQQNINVKPEKGTLLIWPAGWTHSHLGLPSKKENKYIVTGWCSFIETNVYISKNEK
jgi:hypothetical protein